MSTTTNYRIISTAQIDVANLARVLAHSFDPAAAIDRHTEAILSAARARQHALGNPSTPGLHFALDKLLPTRKRVISRHIKKGAVDPDAFENYLAHSRAIARDVIDAAEDADSLAEVTSGVLDDLHSYVIAHRLVAHGYLAAEKALAERIFTDQIEQAPTDDRVARNGDGVARDGNLALAA